MKRDNITSWLEKWSDDKTERKQTIRNTALLLGLLVGVILWALGVGGVI